MRYEVIQTIPYPTAEFAIKSKAGNISKAAFIRKGEKWLFEMEFQQSKYKMVYGKADHSFKAFLKEQLPWTPPIHNPYQLYANGSRVGEVFHRWGHRLMEIDGRKYSTHTVGFGPAGLKCLVFEGWFDQKDNPGGKQIALIETPNLGELLDRYEVSADGDMAAIVALFFCLYWDNSSFHKSDTHYEKTTLKSWGKALELYDPTFKGRITD